MEGGGFESEFLQLKIQAKANPLKSELHILKDHMNLAEKKSHSGTS